MPLPDGRALEVAVTGPDAGVPLLYHHGTPGGALPLRVFAQAASRHGLRFVTLARPGFGGSTRLPGRSVVHIVQDTESVLDWLAVDECLVGGWSGGGPHALACAARLPDRVRGVLHIAGVAPWNPEGLSWLVGMGRGNLEEFAAAAAGEQKLRQLLTPEADQLRTVTADQLASAMASLLPGTDVAVLAGNVGEDLAANMRDGLRESDDGWIDDDLAFVRQWGFDLDEIRVPVDLWHGDADLMVPIAHARWLADHIPDARPHLMDGHGHLSIGAAFADDMMRALIG